MADEGPTTVGSIVAKIKGDLAEWTTAYRTAKAQGRELDEMSPTIKVDANVGEAITKLSAVEAAQEKLGVATDRLKLAYTRLDEVQTAGTAKQSTLMAAHLQAAAAENAHAAATRKLAEAQAAEAAASESETATTKRSNDAHATSMAYWQKIVIVVAALIPLMSPLATQAFSVGAALGAMGVAGVLAVLGIKNAMADGNSTGLQYGAGLRILKGDLDSLSKTSAVAMLKQFQIATAQIDNALPALNGDVRVFSSLLGQAGNFLLASLISGLRIAKPLLVDAGVYIAKVGQDLLTWTNGGRFQSFVNYAIAMLPRVAAALGQLATMLVNVVRASAPIGTVVLGVIRDLASVINAIPLPVLTAMIAAGGSFFLTFKLWSALTPIIMGVAESLVGVAAAEDLALGPIGLVIAAVTALGGAALITAVSMGTTTEAQNVFTAAVQEDNGVIGKNIELLVAKNLQSEGAFKAAKNLGIATNDLVKASLGDADAKKRVNEALDKQAASYAGLRVDMGRGAQGGGAMSKSQAELKAKVDATREAVNGQSAGLKLAIKAYNEVQNALGGTTISTKAQLQAQQGLADEYGASLSAYENAKAAQRQTKDQLDATTLAMRIQDDAAGLLRNALDILNGGSLDVAEAQTGLAAANNGVTDSLKQNGKVVDGSTKGAVANQQAIQQQVAAADQLATAIGKQTGSSEAAVQSYKDSKQAIEDQLAAQGQLTPALQAYIDKLYDVANLKVPPTKLDVDDAAARKKLADWAAFVKQTIPSDARLTVHLDSSGNANGGTIGRAAGGSIGPSGTVYGPGSTTSDSILTRLSRGEEVVKAASASAPGVRPLLKSLNTDPTGTMAALGSSGSGSKVEKHSHLHITVSNNDAEALFDEFSRRQNLQVQ